jgi:hypothetical protein
MLRFIAFCGLLAPLAACAQSDEVDSAPYVDGARKFTDHRAFAVELYNEDGAPAVGENTFYLRVEFPDPTDPEARGRGIPNATVELDAYMPNDDLSMDVVPSVTYLGDGEYAIEGVVLEQTGVWQLDFDIAVGKTVRESVSFAFVVD